MRSIISVDIRYITCLSYHLINFRTANGEGLDNGDQLVELLHMVEVQNRIYAEFDNLSTCIYQRQTIRIT